MALKLLLISFLAASSMVAAAREVVVRNDDSHIYYHGRWDSSPGTWWAGSGFKLAVENLSSMKLILGNHTTDPLTIVGLSVNYEPFRNINISRGENILPLNIKEKHGEDDKSLSVVRVNVEGWQNNRMNLKSIILNSGAKVSGYKPSKLSFVFAGDSLSAGQFLPQGVDQAWPFLVGERFKAEHTVIAQPGAALTDIFSYGNVHGVSFQFFRTEDTGYYYTTDHNFTTPWNFKREEPTPTHLVIHIGANDASQNVTADAFVETYLTFVKHLRTIYEQQPIFVFTPWGWPQPSGPNSFYYQGKYPEIVDKLHAAGDKNVFLVNTTGWVSYADVFPENIHPNVNGHQKIADKFAAWLEDWGLKPESKRSTPAS